jgi:hypothetical protein
MLAFGDTEDTSKTSNGHGGKIGIFARSLGEALARSHS